MSRVNCLTKTELFEISDRFDEINELLELCGENDDRVVDVLNEELEAIEERLTERLAENRRSLFCLVK